MNKKKIIIISSVIVAICVIIGLVQHFTNTHKNENETVSNSEVITESQPSSNSETTTDLITENETEVKNEQKENKNNNKNNKDNTGNKDTEKPNEDANDFPHQNNNPAENKPNNNNNNNNKPPQKEEISVSLTISCRNALKYANIVDVPTSGYFLSTTNYTVKNGKSAFDLLSNACKENGISLYYEEKSYIKGIGGLNEKDCTPESGWMYRVNGNYINKAAIRYILNDGDKVEFYYVTSYKDVP